MNTALAQRTVAIERQPDLAWLRAFNGSRVLPLSARRCTSAPLAADGTPRLPHADYDDDGHLCDDGVERMQNSVQERQLRYVLSALGHHLEERFPECFFTGDVPITERPGDPPTHVVSPDVMFSISAGVHARKSYAASDPAPDFVLEVLTPTTAGRDIGIKKETYLAMGVREYWMFDSSVRFIPSGVRGLALRDVHGQRRFECIEPSPGTPHRRSLVVGLDFRAEDPRPEDVPRYYPGHKRLLIRDPATGNDLESLGEVLTRAESERRRADAAEAEVARLRELLRTRS